MFNDAARQAEKLRIADQFELKPKAVGWLPVVMIPLLALVLSVVPPRTADSAITPTPIDSETTELVQRVAKQLKKQIVKQKQQAEDEGLEEAKNLFEKMERDLEKMSRTKTLNKKEALIALNDLKRQLEERRKELGSSDEMRKALSQMSGLNQGPANKIAKAIKNGDLPQAQKMMNELAKKLRDGELSKEEKEKLQQQIQQMAKSLNEAVKQQEQKKQQLQQELEKAKSEGREGDAQKLQQQLNQMQSQGDAMQQMQQMADALQQAADSMKNGNSSEAADSLEQLSDQLGDMAQEMEELEDLDSAMDQLSQGKQQMQCENCQGNGNQAGNLFGQKPGNGLGRGQGFGDRPEEEDKTNTYETQVRGDLQKGKTVISGFAGGPNRKGVTRKDIKAAIEGRLSEEGGPSETQTLPRVEREQAKQYFDALREGEG